MSRKTKRAMHNCGRQVSYLSGRVPKSCRACFAVNVNRHNGKGMQEESCVLRDLNWVDLGFDKFPE